jgi:hypothetical protein
VISAGPLDTSNPIDRHRRAILAAYSALPKFRQTARPLILKSTGFLKFMFRSLSRNIRSSPRCFSDFFLFRQVNRGYCHLRQKGLGLKMPVILSLAYISSFKDGGMGFTE